MNSYSLWDINLSSREWKGKTTTENNLTTKNNMNSMTITSAGGEKLTVCLFCRNIFLSRRLIYWQERKNFCLLRKTLSVNNKWTSQMLVDPKCAGPFDLFSCSQHTDHPCTAHRGLHLHTHTLNTLMFLNVRKTWSILVRNSLQTSDTTFLSTKKTLL